MLAVVSIAGLSVLLEQPCNCCYGCGGTSNPHVHKQYVTKENPSQECSCFLNGCIHSCTYVHIQQQHSTMEILVRSAPQVGCICNCIKIHIFYELQYMICLSSPSVTGSTCSERTDCPMTQSRSPVPKDSS